MNKTISAFPFYGGKAKMASLICDMLVYDNIDIYIEPFGGGARTLREISPNKNQIYNDSSAGLVSVFELLSDETTAFHLINELYKTEYSPECFERALMLRNSYEDNYLKEKKKRLFISFLRRLGESYHVDMEHTNNLIKDVRKNERTVRTTIKKLFGSITIGEQTLLNKYCDIYDEEIQIYYDVYDEYIQQNLVPYGLAVYNHTTKDWKINCDKVTK